MLDIFEYDFMRNAIMAGILVSVVCGIVGTLVVVRRIVSLSGGISHTAFGGVGIAYYLSVNPILGALAFSLGSAIGIGAVSKYAKEREDTVIGMFWAVGMAVGIFFIGLSPGYYRDLLGYLFGSIISIPTSELLWLLLLDIFVVAMVVLLYKELTAVAFDEEYATVAGLPVTILYYLTLCLVALTVVALIRFVGVILAIALLTIPAAISGKFTHNLQRMMISASILSFLFIFVGLLLSFELDLASGAAIILVAAVSYALFAVFWRIRSGDKEQSQGQES